MAKVIIYEVPAKVVRDDSGHVSLLMDDSGRKRAQGEEEEFAMTDLLNKSLEVSTLNDDAREMAKQSLFNDQKEMAIMIRMRYIE